MINSHIQTNQLLSVDDFNVPKESLAQLASFDSTNANMCENINKNLFIICVLIEWEYDPFQQKKCFKSSSIPASLPFWFQHL